MNRFDHWPLQNALAISRGNNLSKNSLLIYIAELFITIKMSKDIRQWIGLYLTCFGMCILKKILWYVLFCPCFKGLSIFWSRSSQQSGSTVHSPRKSIFVQCFSLLASGAGKTELWRAEGKSRASPRPPETRAGPLLHSAQQRPAPALGMGLCSGV